MALKRHSIFWLVTGALRCNAVVIEPHCYFPDGSIDYDGYVCNMTAVITGEQASSCCRMYDQCNDQGYCFQDWTNRWYRQSCTDQSYESDKCGRLCLAQSFDSGAAFIQSCSWKNQTGCCETDADQSCCNSTFALTPGHLYAAIDTNGRNRLAPAAGENYATDPSTTVVATTIPTLTPYTLNATTSSLPNLITTTATTTTTSSCSQRGVNGSACDSGVPDAQSHQNIAVESGLGAGLGVLSLLLFVGCLYGMRRYHQEHAMRQDLEKRFQAAQSARFVVPELSDERRVFELNPDSEIAELRNTRSVHPGSLDRGK